MQSNRIQKFIDRYVGIPTVISLSLIKRIYSSLRRVVEFQNRGLRNPSIAGFTSERPKKILFIQLSALGDTILAIPTVRAVRSRFPQTEISFLASTTNLTYLQHCPYIDRQIEFRYPLHRMIRTLRQDRYDCVIDLEHWSRFSALLAYAIGASYLIGFNAAHQYRHYLFSDTVPHIPGKHEVLNFLSIAQLLGCDTENTSLAVWIDETERDWCRDVFAQEQVNSSNLLVVLHPEAGRRGEPRRRWLLDHYVELINALSAHYDAQIVLTGAPNEVEVSEWIVERTQCKVVNLSEKTKVNQLAAVFACADLVISGNCGPMHLAAATETPIIAIHGPTNSDQWGPWSDKSTCLEATLSCSPCLNLGFEYACQALPDGTSPCMQTIPVSAVLKACEMYLRHIS